MVGRQLLLAAGFASQLILGPAIASSEGLCSTIQINLGECGGASINGGGIDVGASQDSGGGDGSHTPSRDDAWNDDAWSGGNDLGSGGGGGEFPLGLIRGTATCAADCDLEGLPVVRISDLISFRPTAPSATMEPNGWAVIGLNANFYLATSTETQAGQLLGLEAQVRFTPVSITWDYGDGTIRTTDDPGDSWAALELPDFSPTSTSHVYETAGDYSIAPRVSFTAEYRFGGQPWRTVSGSLDVPANQLVVVAGDAKTVLVDRDCIGNPRGPGC